MADPLSATALRSRIYGVLDEVLETGQPQEVVRKGRLLRIVPVTPKRLDLNLVVRRDVLNCTPDELVETSWEYEWKPEP